MVHPLPSYLIFPYDGFPTLKCSARHLRLALSTKLTAAFHMLLLPRRSAELESFFLDLGILLT